MWFSLLWKFFWAGARAHEYTKLRTVSSRDINSLTCIALYFSEEGQAPLQTPPPLDGNTITVAAKWYDESEISFHVSVILLLAS